MPQPAQNLSTLAVGSFFQTADGTSYLLSKDTGSSPSNLVAFNMKKCFLEELPGTTQVQELILSVVVQPEFTLA